MSERTLSPMAPSDIHCISLPTPYPVGRVIVYLLQGDPPVLVDVGVRGKRSLGELEAGLGEHGVTLEEVGAIFLTHPHFDHSGGAADIARRTGVTVYCHALADRYAFRGQETFTELLGRYGAPQSLVDQLNLLNGAGARFGEPVTEIPTLERLSGGEVVTVGARSIEMLHTPGHNAGHLCFLSRGDGVIFCGDVLLHHITPNPLPHFDDDHPRGRLRSLSLLIRSLEQIEALGAYRGLAGHGKPLSDTAVTARRALDSIRLRSKHVAALCQEHSGETLFALAGHLFAEKEPLGQALAFTELLAHCDQLEAQGRITVDPQTGRVG